MIPFENFDIATSQNVTKANYAIVSIMKKRFVVLIILSCFFSAVISSIQQLRVILYSPMVVSDRNPKGDACYILAGGNAIWERLNAAASLYHMDCIQRIFIMQISEGGPYNFSTRENWPQTQWSVSWLIWKGVPQDCITVIPEVDGPMGTLAEARNVAQLLSEYNDIRRLILVTSAPHTRRSLLAFRKTLPTAITVVPYAATAIEHSAELLEPIWLEYFKLLTYKMYLFVSK